MTSKPIAYVMEQTLGNVTHYVNLRKEEATSPLNLPRWVPIEYQAGRVPWTITGSLRARRALRGMLDQIDGVFVHTTTLAPLAADYFGRVPAVLSTDGTPLNKRQMRGAYGLRPESPLTERAKQRLYQGIFARAAGFVAWSNWAKQSFIDDYGCPEPAVTVIPPGIDVQQFAAGDRDHELPRILFVGGDFERKGGQLLLDVFRRRLLGRAELIIVTRSELAEEPGVRVHRNLQANSAALLSLYRTSDIFSLPTRADCYSLVCMEALAAELPIVSTRVGGIPDMIQEGRTGHLIDVDDSAALADRLEALVADRSHRQGMGKLGRQWALQHFDARQNARRLFEFVRSRC